MSILEVSNVSKSFGGVKANVDISMNVEKGRIVGLIGPNGSGKTTLFNSIVGTYPIDNGSIKFNDKEVSELPVPVIAKLGLLRTFQQTRIYGKLNEDFFNNPQGANRKGRKFIKFCWFISKKKFESR